MDDWNDFGVVQSPDPNTHTTEPHLQYPSSSSHASLPNSDIILDDTSSCNSETLPVPTNPPSVHDVTSDRGSFLSSLPFLSSRKRPENPRGTTSDVPTHQSRNLAIDGLVPLERNAHADRAVPLDDNPDAISTGSESDAREPKSLYIPSRRLVSSDGDSSEFESHERVPRKGELDDAPIDYEFNIEGFRITGKGAGKLAGSEADAQSSINSSSIVRSGKTYTKLEVISSKEIKSLVSFFNIFVVIAILYTLTLIIVAHTEYLTKPELPVPSQLVSDEQKVGKKEQLLLGSLFDFQRMLSKDHSLASVWTPMAIRQMENELKCHGLYWAYDGLSWGEKHPELCLKVNMGTVARQTEGSPGLSEADAGPPEADAGPPEADAGPSETGAGPLEAGAEPPELLGIDDGGPSYAVYFLDFEITVLPSQFKKTSHFMHFLLSALMYLIGVLYSVRIFRAGRHNITHEQTWVLILVFMAALYFNAFEAVVRLVKEFNLKTEFSSLPKPVRELDDFLTILRDVAFTAVTLFYLWASFHSYRILDPTERLGFRSFYLPKLLVLAPYVLFVAISFYVVDIQSSEVPLLSAPAFAFYFGGLQIWNYLTAEAIVAIVKTIYEFFIICIIIWEAVRTMRVLENASYMKNRTKRVGFRFFFYLNFMFYALFIVLNCILVFGKPKGENILRLAPGTGFVIVDVIMYWSLGANILVFGYVLCTAYVHLPCTSVGPIKGWFKSSKLAPSGSRYSYSNSDSASETEVPSIILTEKEEKIRVGTWPSDEDTPVSSYSRDEELKHPIIEPFTYRMGESKNSLQLKANCFTMQTHVIMFNFAWYVYYYDTPKLESFRPKENPLPFAFKIAAHIKSPETDTQVLVVDCTDRIIITFRGTTSLKNLRTSLQMNHSLLSSVVQKSVTGEDETARLKRLFGARYMKGKVHKGFAQAYTSVADEVMEKVRMLRAKKKRAVFLTGHSLGGALATLCSLDLWVKLDISRREIFVSTFGSPRVGNQDFAAVYGEVVPLHWRIVVQPDMVAKLPRVGYTHVGKKVVLTPHGEMLIDPNAFEHRPWSGEAAGFAYHRKASYLLAMRAWCIRHHELTYTPVFWPFPVRPDDERRFAGALDSDEEQPPGRKVTAKIVRMDALVDALDTPDTGLSNMVVVDKWARLTRRLMLNHALTRT